MPYAFFNLLHLALAVSYGYTGFHIVRAVPPTRDSDLVDPLVEGARG
jgi:hypothetical protein